MNSEEFVEHIGRSYRDLYRLAVRRVDDPRHRLSPEMMVLLSHLAEAGPSTLGELSRHIDRAPSTLSAKVTGLERAGLVTRHRDDTDRRRSLIWLTPLGRATYVESLRVLDHDLLRRAADRLTVDQRSSLIELIDQFVKDIRAEGSINHRSRPTGKELQ